MQVDHLCVAQANEPFELISKKEVPQYADTISYPKGKRNHIFIYRSYLFLTDCAKHVISSI